MYTKENIISLFSRYSNEQIAAGQKAYLKNKFEFFGIKAPERRTIQRPILLKNNMPDKIEAFLLIRELWEEPQRELQYLAMELLFKYQNEFEKEDIHLIVYMITHKSWWDTVDFLAANLVGRYFKKFTRERDGIIENWLSSGDLWLQRTCLLYQLKYKDETDTEKLDKIIIRLNGTKEFFISKAIGWILREYSKTDPEWVIRYVEEHALSTLSQREALKVVNR